MDRKLSFALAGLVLCALALNGYAQVPSYGRAIKSTQNVGVLGKDLAGDSTNFHTGATSFEAQDLAVPGNNALSVAVGRSYAVGFDRMKAAVHGENPGDVVYTTRQYAFGDWDLDIPQISGVFTRAMGWQINSTTPLNRCSVVGQVTPLGTPATGDAKLKSGYGYDDVIVWGGNTLRAAGRDQVMLLAMAPNNNRPSTGGPYHWLTKDDWWVSCLPSIANGAGEGFLAIAPDGTKYTFNWISKRDLTLIRVTEGMGEDGGAPYKNFDTYLSEYFMLPTRVEDRFGNWVEYHYSSDSFAKLLSVTSSDGRQLNLAYNAQGFVDTLSDGTRTVRYEYNGTSLSRVVLPDNSAWQYGFSQLGGAWPYIPPNTLCDEDAEFVNYNCIGGGAIDYAQTGYVIHPGGARVDFTFAFHSAPTVPPNGGSFQYSGTSVFGIKEKIVTGPGLPSLKWYYAFAPTREETQAQCRAGACPTRLWTDEISPDYRVHRRMYGLVGFQDQGLLLQELRGVVPVSTSTTTVPTSSPRITRAMLINDVDIVDDPTPVVTTTTTITGAPQFFEEVDYSYRIGSQLGRNPMGVLYPSTSDVFWTERRLPVSQRKTYLQGESFTWQVNTWDSFDRPVSVSKVSTLNAGKSETTEYQDDLGKWVLGLVKKKTLSGVIVPVEETVYDANLLSWKLYSSGKLQQTLTYNADGTLATVSDGRDGTGAETTVTLSDWKRGIPQIIRYPATPEAPSGATQSAVVNGVGWINSVTDENGYTTSYGYDPVGRLNRITYPVSDTVAWNETTISFAPFVAGAELGIPAGHWKQTVTTGNAQKVTYFDAMWRPLVEESFDATNATTKANTLSQVVKRYDGDGHVIFQSTAQRDITDYAAVLLGTRTGYDALGRPARIEQDSELGSPAVTTIEYLTGFKRKTTNPRLQATVESFQGYEAPSFDAPVQIDAPENVRSSIVRDVFGKPTQITRGSGS